MDTAVKKKFDIYPQRASTVLHGIRKLIFEVAEEYNTGNIVETLKWREPSYLTPQGSTIRFDWKKKTPEHCYIYFNCQTTLIETFKELYGDTFTYENNRALVFQMNTPIPESELRHCIALSLQYHKLKHLPLLGA
jgi:hypothetical protein